MLQKLLLMSWLIGLMNARHSIVPINVAAAWPEREETAHAIPNDLGHTISRPLRIRPG